MFKFKKHFPIELREKGVQKKYPYEWNNVHNIVKILIGNFLIRMTFYYR